METPLTPHGSLLMYGLTEERAPEDQQPSLRTALQLQAEFLGTGCVPHISVHTSLTVPSPSVPAGLLHPQQLSLSVPHQVPKPCKSAVTWGRKRWVSGPEVGIKQFPSQHTASLNCTGQLD